MKYKILNECGYQEALLGLGLSHGLTSGDTSLTSGTMSKLERIAKTLGAKDGGHNKFLESIQVWIDITAPRYFWSQFDTYRVGITKQSESTMHTLLKYPITQDMFEAPIPEAMLSELEILRLAMDLPKLKNALPEGFLQRRIVCMNYKAIRNMINQRRTHRLQQWKDFCGYLIDNLIYYQKLNLHKG